MEHGVDDDSVDDLLDEEPAQSAPETNPASAREIRPEDGEIVREGYQWAIDCFWVYDHLGERMTKAIAGPRRWAQWQEAKRDTQYFIQQTLPKAMPLLEKARDKAGTDDVSVREERKGIAELQRICRDAVEEAKAVQV